MRTPDPFRGAILRPYCVAALWSTSYFGDMDPETCDHAPESMDDIAEPEDCTPDLLAELRAECAAFLFNARRLLRPFIARDGMRETLERAGHDLWLTSQGHGAGFWDGDWCNVGDELTKLAETFGSTNRDLYCAGDFDSCAVK